MIKAFGEQLFRSGFIHGDPHPANGKSEGWAREVGGGGAEGKVRELLGMQEKKGWEVQEEDSDLELGKLLITLYFAMCSDDEIESQFKITRQH